MGNLVNFAAVAGVVFLCWEVQHFLRGWLYLEQQKVHALEGIRTQLENIEMDIRDNRSK